MTAWSALLGERAHGGDVSPYAAPARALDLAHLPEAYVKVGQLDLCSDEAIDYAKRLSAAGVQLELHVRPGVPHGFDFVAPHADVARRSHDDRARAILAV